MPHKREHLPDSFKAVSYLTEVEYYCKKIGDTTYEVSWGTPSAFNTPGSTTYAEGALKEIIFSDKAWKIIEEDSVACDTLEAIKTFCKANSQHTVVISEKGFEVYWDECGGEPLVAESEEKLLDVLKAVTLIESCYN